ncbi:MAG: hypothetical protein ACJ0DD_04225 [Paracoccaceae bacterium]
MKIRMLISSFTFFLFFTSLCFGEDLEARIKKLETIQNSMISILSNTMLDEVLDRAIEVVEFAIDEKEAECIKKELSTGSKINILAYVTIAELLLNKISVTEETFKEQVPFADMQSVISQLDEVDKKCDCGGEPC